MQILNYLYFFIISLLGLKYLFQNKGLVVHPWNKKQKLLFSGPELFWTLTFSTGLLAFSNLTGSLMAIRLLVLETFCIIGLFLVKNRPVWNPIVLLYLFYMIWIIIGLSYTSSIEYGIRVILKYLYPILIILFSSAVVRNNEVFFKSAKGARVVAIICIIFAFVPFLSRLVPGVFWYGTAAAINFISMFIFSLSMFFFCGKNKRDLFYSILFLIPCIIWVFRTSILGSVISLMTFFVFKDKLKSLPIIFAIIILSISSVFFIPGIREKTFYNKGTTIEDLQLNNISSDDIDTNGRLAVWEWSINKYFYGHEIIGSGTGNLQNVFYSLQHPFGTIKIVHNDYVQIICDNGLIGLLLFCSTFIFLIIHCFLVHNNRKYSYSIRICAIIAGSSMAGILLTMYTDNVVNYSMSTISYPCGFYGMMLGLMQSEKKNRYVV